MKRNTLMKRMAVVALAATMSIGMAVPAMAASSVTSAIDGKTKSESNIPNVRTAGSAKDLTDAIDKVNLKGITTDAQAQAKKTDIENAAKSATLTGGRTVTNASTRYDAEASSYITTVQTKANDKDEEGLTYTISTPVESLVRAKSVALVTPVQKANSVNLIYPDNNRDAGYSEQIYWNNYNLNTFKKDAAALTFSAKEAYATPESESAWKKMTQQTNSLSAGYTIVDNNGNPATLPNNSNHDDQYRNYASKVVFGNGNVSARVDDSKEAVYFTGNKFGTTGFEISRVHWQWRDNAWYARTEKFYATFTVMISNNTLSELLDEFRATIPSAQAQTAQSALQYTQSGFQAVLDAKDPKVSDFSFDSDTAVNEAAFEKKMNQKIQLVAHASNIADFHAATVDRDGWYKANVAVSRRDAGTYFFNEDAIDFTIPQGNPYTDLDSSKYYYNNVVKALKDGVVTPKDATTFGVNDTVTRADFITWLWRKNGSPVVGTADHFKDYTDVADLSNDTKTAINWATEKGYIDGWTASTFNPTHTLTRGQVVQIIWNTFGRPQGNNETTFSDMSHTAWYEEAVDWAASKKVAKVAGYADGTFRGDNEVKKADAVEFLYRTAE